MTTAAATASRLLAVALCLAAVAALAVVTLHAQPPQAKPDVALKAAIDKEVVDGDLKAAIEMYRALASAADRAVAGQALLRMGQCYEKLGAAQGAQARKAYERVLAQFADQPQLAAQARARLAALGGAADRPTVAATPPRLPGALRRVYEHADGYVVQWVSRDGRFAVIRPGSPTQRVDALIVRDLMSGDERRVQLGDVPTDSSVGPVGLSPDGRLLAYMVVAGSGSSLSTLQMKTELRVVPVEGGQPRTLTSAQGNLTAQWNEDGHTLSTVLFPIGPGARTIDVGTISAADGSPIKKGSVPRGSVNAVFQMGAPVSPDGRFLAVQESTQLGLLLSVIDIETGIKTPVTERGLASLATGWTPDGRGLLFFSDRSGSLALWRVPVHEGRPAGPPALLRSLAGRLGDFQAPRITLDGTLFYNQTIQAREWAVVRVDAVTGRVTGAPTPLPDVSAACYWDWSPDSTSVVYATRLQGKSDDTAIPCSVLAIRSFVDGSTRVLSSDFAAVAMPRWSPDASRILVRGTRAGITGVYAVDAASGSTTLVVENTTNPVTGESILTPDWAPDGKSILLGRYDAGKHSIVQRDLATGAETERYAIQSPGGLWLDTASVARDGSVCVVGWKDVPRGTRMVVLVPPNGGAPRTVYSSDSTGSGRVRNGACATDGRNVWVSVSAGSTADGSPPRLLLVPSAGGPPVDGGLATRGLDAIRQSPDGTRLLVQIGYSVTSTWAIDGFLTQEPARASAGTERSSGPAFRRLTTGLAPGDDDGEASAVVSGDGRSLIYASKDPTQPGLIVLDTATGARRVLASDEAAGGTLSHPTISPDGRRLAYLWVASNARTVSTRIVELVGSAPVSVRTETSPTPFAELRLRAFRAVPPSWSPDGARLLVSDLADGTHVALRWIGVGTGDERAIGARYDIQTMASPLGIAPGGQFAVRVGSSRTGSSGAPSSSPTQVLVSSLATGSEVPIGDLSAQNSSPQWTADGGGVVFASAKGSSRALLVQRIANGKPAGEPQIIQQNVRLVEPVAVARQGTIYYRTRVPVSGVAGYLAGIDARTGALVDSPRRLQEREVPDPQPSPARDWAPDGQSYVYASKPASGPASTAARASQLFIRSIAEGQERVLAPGLMMSGAIQSSRDGRSILVFGSTESEPANPGLWRVDRETGSAALLATGGMTGYDETPDGKGVVVIRREGEKVRGVVRDLETGSEREWLSLPAPVTTSGRPCVSPDGTHVAVYLTDSFSGRKEISLIPLAGGPRRVLLAGFGNDISGMAGCWTADGKALWVVRGRVSSWLYAGAGEPQAPGVLWRVPIDGSSPVKTGLAMSGLVNIRVSPEGTRVLFDGRRDALELWAADGTLPTTGKK